MRSDLPRAITNFNYIFNLVVLYRLNLYSFTPLAQTMCNFNIGLQVLPFSILSENKDTVLIGFTISASLKFDPCLPGTVFTY